ncbi:LacI family DNA-binding transcriptional regulator [Ktedonospora formicarum]|uniref:LacI family transcriptional regulator n=1 Tax=Ktedonospora formicarum TaxID=2778364 RepID=A0A8J3I5P6_9CHLR|nr:LacI family DNA-binding transcriptional regulator [Ktedonospora formicarum]GHO46582.1 LacI family transcriptional regulator [Ktedonospora formicarum]
MELGKGNRSVTSVDVARKAGVSQSAVSLVFAGKAEGRVSAQTQREILRVAQELGYRPNTVARMLRLGHTNIIALVIPDVSNPFFAAVLKGAEQAARQQNYAVVLVNIEDDLSWQGVVMDALTAHSIGGFVLCSVRPSEDVDLTLLRYRAVMVDVTHPEISSMLLDIVGGTRAAMRHLLGLGHRKIAHLATTVDAETFHQRRDTYKQELLGAGLLVRDDYTAYAALESGAAQRAARTLLQVADPPTAIFCDDDILAIGAYKAAQEAGLKIPDDLSVVGFDDGLIAQTLTPALTTVAVPATALGRRATEILLADFQIPHEPHREVMPLELRVRSSTAAPRNSTAM